MKSLFVVVLMLTGLALTGCGSDSTYYSPPPQPQLLFSRILSDATLDGDIARPVAGGDAIITQGSAQSYYVGFDPADGAELRTFLQFPLTGADGVPGNAAVQEATLDFVINGIQPNPFVGTIPIRIDLVDLTPPILYAEDFDRTTQPALATITLSPPISQADFGQPVSVDVTSLMQKAQLLGLPLFQVRILIDPGFARSGLIEINDATGANRRVLAPLLDVSYY